MPDKEESSIERLKKTLYSRNEKIIPKEKRTSMQNLDMEAPTSWGQAKSFQFSPEMMSRKNNSFFNKFLIGSLVFFVVSLGVAIFIFFGGVNMISSDNLDIKITAQSSVSSGEELDIGLSILNGNNTDLENVVLFIEYPEGSEIIGEENRIITRDRISLDTIAQGKSKDYTIRALLFGEKDIVKTFTFKIEYKVKGSNAIFSKEKTYDVLIGSSPILLDVSYPKEVNSGQQMTLSINITSNSSVPIKNTLVKVEYPYGFTYKSSNIKPLSDNSVWNIGDLRNGDKKTLSVTGVIIGQNMEDRSFIISVGSQNPQIKSDIDTILVEETETVGIRKSFFDLQTIVGGGNVKSVGQFSPVTINWQNTLPDKILNAKIEATLSGNILDRSKVLVGDSGFYRSVDNVVLWDKNTTENLLQITPGGSGSVSLTLVSLTNPVLVRSIKNPHIDLHIVMTGDRSGLDSATISSSEDVTIKINSTLELNSQSFRSVGPFNNIGPIPPRADIESTYTITWTITNTTNDLSGVAVSAVLPTGVIWKGETQPVSERINYNQDTRTVSWNIGNVSAGVGFTLSPKTVSFKVGIIPSINQIGSAPTLLSQINATATDTYTEGQIWATIPPVTTQYSDPDYKAGNNIVVK
ncbi:MAG: hypothetical protein A3H52_01890 [Candidatus Zambryskibacteria bacterium RIFCSPLOWO2_02_FULL_39_26]|uniref:Uncharacterized protein n=1 Tax=Candidatus Zambryskibacteria bacterium RIFCSPLOWO2_12_FULL_39_23 TaxID=1802776 RepID=A0A1G2UR96_9BACT|nr:MAG: hypothetical protein A2W51_00235 [Candidatus Zambryskibacteria bacterium RIFCSPHIGHO2_02_39_10]OHB00227.1 MAG: hypothetical protein A3E59_01535 [Candidatus Zambryskibacteria bacterium RIFCSPHIGHO2_12_FULL_39_47]OHB10046.1 MAG: hypothetical protein A3H52_01890 [Candidatus Zambryskibacteria bacterium RIFCSPLOWO2_02_FULL_39_26]OHB11876.1 MAG: hypothetical protein A3G99_00950 [Candidatus Zambryskibacteria bacterium RIFCSPLOWO2_12_FULL_39_23]